MTKRSTYIVIILILMYSCQLLAEEADKGEALPLAKTPQTTKPLEAKAENTPASAGRKLALGFNLDLLPTVMSAATKHFGMAGQTWVGIDHVMLRLVVAHMHMPDALNGGGKFTGQETTAAALIVDYAFGEHFDGWWIGTGVELWDSNIGLKTARERVQWNNVVWTLGGGYIWCIVDNFYVNPWVATHVFVSNPEIRIGSEKRKPFPITGEASLKIGYFFDL